MGAGFMGVAVRGAVRGAAAASFLSEIENSAATPGLRIVAGIAGAGGSGKTALLDAVEEHYRAAGAEVLRGASALDLPPGSGHTAVLVDDAHLLTSSDIERISTLVEDRAGTVIVAYRPHPRPPALRPLLAALEQHHPTVVLGPLTRSEISAHAGAALGTPVPPGLVELVTELTGGMTWLVQRLLTGLQQEGWQPGSPPAVPRSVLDNLAYDLDEVDPALRGLLLALSVGFGPRQVPPMAEHGDEAVDAILARGRAAGFLLPDGRIAPLVRRAVLLTTPKYHVRGLQQALVDTLAADGLPLAEVARDLARDGFTDPRVAAALEQAGDAALAEQPDLAAALYEEAATAGGNGLPTAARRAQAAAATGDLDGACRILDQLLAQDSIPDLTRAVDVSASVWAQRGMLSRAAEVYRWLGETRAGGSAALAAVAMMGSGDRDGAESMLQSAASSGSPTLLAVSVALMGQGIADSLGPTPTQALPVLIRASDMMTASGQAVPLPDSPAALAALVALNSGELEVAESVLDAALNGRQGGAAARPRLLLLRAWTALQQDQPERASTLAADAASAPGGLPPRDEFFHTALLVGLARRTGDVPTLVTAWQRAREGILRISIDLYCLLPLGELLVAAARLRDSARLDFQLNEAWALLARLGKPALWSVPLHWSAVQAALLSERPGDLAPHAAALVRAAGSYHLASILAAAGRAWISVLAGNFAVDTVETAARELAATGFRWDGSRLAGHAAARADDRRDMARLMACARDLHPTLPATAPAPAQSAPAGAGARRRPAPRPRAAAGDGSGLSAREREVARLVLEGRTYREIGEAIFISPRTAEHHIARIRRRLGVTNRADLLIQLRLALGRTDDTAD